MCCDNGGREDEHDAAHSCGLASCHIQPVLHMHTPLEAGDLRVWVDCLLLICSALFLGGGKYRGAWHCTRAVYAAAGLAGFWRGWAANYARIGPQTVVTLVVAEKLRQLAGLASL